MATSTVALKDITVDPTIQIRRSNHEPTIRRYEESFDKLPPVVVFKTADGMLLADGFHRVAAAERLGKYHVEAEIKKGTRDDALEYAVVANTKNADPLTPDERDEGIRRLKQLHPKWTLREIAEVMSVSYVTVKRVFDVDEVRRSVVVPVTRVTTSHYSEIAAAPKKDWEPLVKAAEKRAWSRDDTRQAVQNLKDPNVPAEHKRSMLAGRADPLIPTESGLAASPGVVSRRLRDMQANDAL
ncbi:MAG: ParB/RepB/Spo0J family partition protein, partial [Gammaproteobacteria bacterium]